MKDSNSYRAYRVILYIGLLLLCSNLVSQVTADDIKREKLVLNLKRGIIRITAYKGSDAKDIGTGILIGEEGSYYYYLTAYHIVEEANKIEIECFDKIGTPFPATVFRNKCDNVNDICVLEVSKYASAGAIQEQLYETDPEEINVDETVHMIGHPPDHEWQLTSTKLKQKIGNRLLLNPGVIKPAHSGAPLMNNQGLVIGIILGNTAVGVGEALRIDVAIAILKNWDVPVVTKIIVDFCSLIQKIPDWSKNDFYDIKGQEVKIGDMLFWEIRDKTMDITGLGHSMLVWQKKDPWETSKDDCTVYYAFLGRHAPSEVKKLMEQLAQKMHDCNPDFKFSRWSWSGDYYVGFSFRKGMWETPFEWKIQYSTETNGLYLLFFRSFNTEISNRLHQEKPFIADFYFLWEREY